MSDLQKRMLEKLGEEALRMARRSIRSDTLRRAIRFEHLAPGEARLYIPHFWAIYQHDGRGTVRPTTKRFLVYYRDPNDDPRLKGGYPIELKDIKRLTRDQFVAGAEENRRRYLANPAGGRQQFMVVREASGPTRPTRSYPFFEAGMLGMPAIADRILDALMQTEMRTLAGRDRDVAQLKL